MKKLAAAAVTAAAIAAVQAAPAEAAPVTLTAKMTGAQEVPDKGDPNGRGTFTITVDGNRVCAKGTFSKIEKPAAVHIHKGPRGKAGDVKVDFTKGIAKILDGKRYCVTSAEGPRIVKRPGSYYLNAHTKSFPGGAVRGQLAR